ncbi:MAG: GNAT family N-acetyltransferase [Propionivibrio sp.]
MRHNIVLDGLAFRLRPIGDTDAAFALTLRNHPDLGRFLHATPLDLESQLDWLARYYERPGDWYFVLERKLDRTPEGLISLYDHDKHQHSAEWGRWILRPGSLAAIESAWLIYRCAFEQLDLREVYCRTVADNQSVVSFHDSCGISKRTLLPKHFKLNGRDLDAVEHRIDLANWAPLAKRLEFLAERTARRIQRDA